MLAMAAALGRLPGEVTIVLMEIGDVTPGDELSASVTKALPDLGSAVVKELHREEAAR